MYNYFTFILWALLHKGSCSLWASLYWAADFVIIIVHSVLCSVQYVTVQLSWVTYRTVGSALGRERGARMAIDSASVHSLSQRKAGQWSTATRFVR